MGNALREKALIHWLGRSAEALTYEERARRFYAELADGNRLRDVEREAGIDEFVRTLTLERVLREEQHGENTRDSTTIRKFREEHESALARIRDDASHQSVFRDLVNTGRPLIIVTVNFDHVLETELGNDRIRPFVTETDYAEFSDHLHSYLEGDAAIPYVKLHGDIASPETIVANIDETEGGLSKARLNALRALRDRQGPVRPWIYIGYSMRDLDVTEVLAAPDVGSGLIEWWVGPFIDPSVRLFIDNHRLAKWRAEQRSYTVEERYVTLTSNEYIGHLTKSIVEFHS
jgi:hypothetical protein